MSRSRGNSQRIQHRRGSASEWTALNPILLAGELGYETDTTRIKVGDGVTQWVNLSYVGQFGANELDGLSDVTITSPATGAVLRYDGTAWIDQTLSKSDIGLSNVDNTSDASKPISTATQTALDGKANATHTHAASAVVSGQFDIARIPTGATASTVCIGNDARLTDARTPLAHTHGSITNAGAIGTTSGQIVVTTTSGVLTTAATISNTQVSGLGTLATQSSVAYSSLTGTPSTFTPPMASASVLGGVRIGSGISIDASGIISASSGYTLPSATTTTLGGVIVGTGLGVTSGTASVTYGTTAGTACQGNDSRLSDSRAPTGAAGGDLTGTYPNPQIAAGAVVTADLANDAVTYAKLQNVSATDRLLGRSTAGAGDVEEITCTAFARSILDDADAATSRTTLGLGTISTQASSAVAITGGAINGTTIGATTASTGAFTTVTASQAIQTSGGRALFRAVTEQYGVGVAFSGTSGFVYFGARNESATPDAVISAAGGNTLMTLQNGGNVGIGTTSPAARLDVRRTNTYVQFCDSVFVTAAFGPRENNDGICTVTHSWSTVGSGNYWQEDYASGSYQFSRVASSVSTPVMTVLSSGNVGIGTTSPAARLSVKSASSGDGIYIDRSGASAVTKLQFRNEIGAASTAITNVGTSDAMAFEVGGATERMRIDAGGNVGIGTASPANRLHVDAASNFSPLAVGGSDAVSGIQFRNTGGTLGYIYYDTTPSMIFHVAASEKMRILTNGNVGIGTASPAISSGIGLHIGGSTMRLDAARTPASSTATGNTGEHCWDANYFYVCIATNTWRRIALTAW